MKYLLDTCIVSELANRNPNPGVIAWLENQRSDDLFISVLTVGELEKGITKLGSGGRVAALRKWLEQDISGSFADRILPVTDEISRQWGRISGRSELGGLKRPVVDSLLAATASVHDLTLVTRNVRDMTGTGVPVFNPFSDHSRPTA